MPTSSSKLPSYQKLRHHGDDDEDDEDNGFYYDFGKERVVARRPRTSSVALRRRLRLSRPRLKVRVVNFRKLLLLKKKIKVMCSRLGVTYKNVVQRFKEGQSHFGDIFAGNYIFLQVNPSSLKSLDVNPHKKNDILVGGGGGEQKQIQLRHLQYVQSFPMGMGYTFPRN